MKKPRFKPGDIYECCSFHPCLCLGVDNEERTIWGISLVDGSYPRSCDLDSCGVRKLSLEEAFSWKQNGPKELPEGFTFLPDRQWWSPRPLEGFNPGSFVEHFFRSSLNFLRNYLENELGESISGWYSASSEFDEMADPPYARVSYETKGTNTSAHIQVEAFKEGNMWPIKKILVQLKNQREPLNFEGEQVRGCGYEK